jgi:hypothetical protein
MSGKISSEKGRADIAGSETPTKLDNNNSLYIIKNASL